MARRKINSKDGSIFTLTLEKNGKKTILHFHDGETFRYARIEARTRGFEVVEYDGFGIVSFGTVKTAMESAELCCR
jgi:hypothetical protein